MLDKGQELDWFGSRMIVWVRGHRIGGFIAFLVANWSTAHPIVDLRFSRTAILAIGNALMGLLIGALFTPQFAICRVHAEFYCITQRSRLVWL